MLQLEMALENPLYDSLKSDFKGINSSDAISLGWNFAMITVMIMIMIMIFGAPSPNKVLAYRRLQMLSLIHI